MLQEFAVDFQPPQKGLNGATGLYAGEQDLFCFLIDPDGWAEIEGEAFAPGFFSGTPKSASVARHPDVLVSGGLPEPHRLGCDRSRRVHPQAHRKRPFGSVRNATHHRGTVAKRDERREGFANGHRQGHADDARRRRRRSA